MSERNVEETSGGSREPRGMIVTRRSEAQQLALRWVDERYRGLKRGLGVTRKWLANQIAILGLTEDETDSLLAIRDKYSAGLPSVVKWLNKGVSVEDVAAAYETRAVISAEAPPGESKDTPSIGVLLRITEIFPSEDLHEPGCGTHLIEILDELRMRFPYLKYGDELFKLLCAAGKAYHLADVETALLAMDERRALQKHELDEEHDGDDRDGGNHHNSDF